jgi:hypothetical protein
MTEPSLEMPKDDAHGVTANRRNGSADPLHVVEAAAIVPGAPAEPIMVPPTRFLFRGEEQAKSPPSATIGSDRSEVRIADIRKNRTDCRGEKIDFVYFRRQDYAIYRSAGSIMVHYSDDPKIANEQATNTAELLPLRGTLQNLVKDMVSPHAYHWQIAEAFRLGLDKQKDAAKRTLEAAIEHVMAKRISKGRTWYIFYSGIAAIMVVLGAIAAALWCPFAVPPTPAGTGLHHFLMATGSGAMGALLSIAIAIRARTQVTDGDRVSNAIDGTLRILIGVISAAALYLVLDSNLLDGVSLSVEKLGKERVWQIALLSGFVAGFLERLVPDLLENKVAAGIAK